jgi:DNA polymerase-3 subunit delta'
MFPDFFGHAPVAAALEQMLASGRIPQTILFSGPEGVGKATLARRFGAAIVGSPEKIERDDLSLPHNLEIVAGRESWPPEKRNDDPLLFATHPDFVTFAPDGPLRQISISQMRLLREQARFKPLKGQRRVFLVDQIDRANDQAANSLLKTLEEPPEHLLLLLTASNAYNLLPTIRSRAVPFHLSPLSAPEMAAFAGARSLSDGTRRASLAAGSPGVAVSLDLELYDKRRSGMLLLVKVAAGLAPFSAWLPVSETIGRSRSDRLEFHIKVLYGLLRDLLMAREGGDIGNADIGAELDSIARAVSFEWIRRAAAKVDDLSSLLARNIQKTIALDALIIDMRR